MKTLVFGLDKVFTFAVETLTAPYDIKIEVKTKGTPTELRLNIRPGAVNFVREMAGLFEIVVWSGQSSAVSNAIIRALDPFNEYVAHRLYIDHCVRHEDKIIKDISMFENRPHDDVVIVDTSMWSAAHQTTNFLPIVPFTKDRNDRELIELSVFLRHLYDHPCVTNVLREWFFSHGGYSN